MYKVVGDNIIIIIMAVLGRRAEFAVSISVHLLDQTGDLLAGELFVVPSAPGERRPPARRLDLEKEDSFIEDTVDLQGSLLLSHVTAANSIERPHRASQWS